MQEQIWDRGLVGDALDIARSDDHRLRVVAGPGTGKTFALMRLVTRLLEQEQDPRRILVVTFTRTAARDLQRELAELNVPGCNEVVAGTLHSYCFRVLTRAAQLQALNRHPRPLVSVRLHGGFLGFEYGPLLQDVDNQDVFGNKRQRIARIRAFEAAWARQQHEEPGFIADPVDLQFQEALLSWLRFHQCILIGEVVPLALEYLRENAAAPALNAFDRVIVDEYQDLNRAEQSIIDVMAANSTLDVVGDANQSIYGFKHAHPEGIADFGARHADTVDRELRECRRCPTRVVIAANQLIARNHPGERIPAAIAPFEGNPEGHIVRTQWPTLGAEVSGLAAFIRHLIDVNAYTAGDIMVLTYRRLVGYALRNALRSDNIQAHSFFSEEALEGGEAQEAYALLSLLCNNEDRAALRFFLGLGSGDWRFNQYAKVRQHCEQSGQSPFEMLTQVAAGELPRTGLTTLLRRFETLTQRLVELNNLTGSALVDAILPPGLQWSDGLRELLAGMEIDDLTTRNDLLETLSNSISRPEIPVNPDFVRVMSLHASKGLTSKVVIVMLLVNSVLPRDSEGTPAEQERERREQRRLFYVAVTRPKELLVLSSPASLTKRQAESLGVVTQRNGQTTASSFIGELGLPGAATAGARWAREGFPL